MTIINHDFIPGNHLESERSFYTHHGIYMGDNKVIHYAGLCDGFKVGKIEIISLTDFTNGRKTHTVPHPNRKYSCAETLERAQSRLGENQYDIFFNNCEHFVNWCIEGKSSSSQVLKAVNQFLITLPAIVISSAVAYKQFKNN